MLGNRAKESSWTSIGRKYFAVFPRPPGTTRAVKVLGEQFVETTTPDRVERAVGRAEQQAFHEQFIAPNVRGITSSCVRAEVCLYTNTPDDHCSDHGFKHSAALGEAVAQFIATGWSTLDLAPFRSR